MAIHRFHPNNISMRSCFFVFASVLALATLAAALVVGIRIIVKQYIINTETI